jgi:hypothetical protein
MMYCSAAFRSSRARQHDFFRLLPGTFMEAGDKKIKDEGKAGNRNDRRVELAAGAAPVRTSEEVRLAPRLPDDFR